MKSFIFRSLIFIFICISFFYFIFSLADGQSDGMYLKFTTPKQSSLIIGTSKAAQGIRPDILNQKLDRSDLYNYAFTVVQSPYGPYYLKSIQRKLELSNREGIFILQVDPYSISSTSDDPNDTEFFRERNGPVGKIENVNSKPNLEYLIWHYPFQYSFIFKRHLGAVGKGFLHDDGWVELDKNMDSTAVNERIKGKTKAYKIRTTEYKISTIRIKYLKSTIDYLQNHGKVYLVRVPIAEPLFELENQLDRNFDNRLNSIAEDFNIPYFNYSGLSKDYKYSDGNHLSTDSSVDFSELLANDIIKWNSDSSP